MLPVLNARAVELAIRFGLAMHGRVNPRSVFARKNYFYPDLPKGYQISQFEEPVVTGGHVDVESETGEIRRIRITRAHLEEDAGKSIHDPALAGSRRLARRPEPGRACPCSRSCRSRTCGRPRRRAPTCAPCARSCGTSASPTPIMEKGQFRCDANVSLRPRGSDPLGTRTEIKNLNSFANVEAAIEAEALRQAEVLDAGGRVVQATMAFDPVRGATRVMRLKENSDDYRYFPDPDLIPLVISGAQIEAVRAAMPELPEERCARLQREHDLSQHDARILTASRTLADFYEAVVAARAEAGGDKPKTVANWILRDLLRALKEARARGRGRPDHPRRSRRPDRPRRGGPAHGEERPGAGAGARRQRGGDPGS